MFLFVSLAYSARQTYPLVHYTYIDLFLSLYTIWLSYILAMRPAFACCGRRNISIGYNVSKRRDLARGRETLVLCLLFLSQPHCHILVLFCHKFALIFVIGLLYTTHRDPHASCLLAPKLSGAFEFVAALRVS